MHLVAFDCVRGSARAFGVSSKGSVGAACVWAGMSVLDFDLKRPTATLVATDGQTDKQTYIVGYRKWLLYARAYAPTVIVLRSHTPGRRPRTPG